MRSLRTLFAVLAVLLLAPLSASALTSYYLDPAGPDGLGTQASPWNDMTAAHWATVNATMATPDNVVVYCSARQSGSDTDSLWAHGVDLTQRSTSVTTRLTFDGRSFWNSGPTWSAYMGNSRCRVQGFNASASTGPSPKLNNMTIDGFHVVQAGETVNWGSLIGICGDHWVVQNNDISGVSNPTLTTGILMIPTADGVHEGAANPCPPSTDIQISFNTVHGMSAIPIYIGGGGCSGPLDLDTGKFNVGNGRCQTSATNPTSYSHSNILIKGNTLYDCLTTGPGDTACLGLKAALSNVTILGNSIRNDSNSNVITCIDIQGTTTVDSGGGFGSVNQNILVDSNLIAACPGTGASSWQGISVTNSWGTPNGVMLRNNVLHDIRKLGGGAACINIENAQTSNGIQVYNNTLYRCDGPALNINRSLPNYNGTVTYTNNAVLNPGGIDTQFAGAVSSDHNAYDGTWSGTCTACVATLTAAAFVNADVFDFHPSVSSVLRNAGANLSPVFTYDYAGQARPLSGMWTIGAYEGP